MPQRRIDSGIWTDPWFQGLTAEQGHLFIYLWSNDHCNQAGLYQITLSTIAFETKLPLEKVAEILDALKPKVTWAAEDNLVWIKNFLSRQVNSPTFATAAYNCIKTISNNGNQELIGEFIKYNEELWYRYGINIIPIPPNPNSNPNTKPNSKGKPKRKGVVKGEREKANKIWSQVLEELKLQVSKSNYRTWLSGTEGLGFEGGTLFVGVPNNFVKEYLDKNQRSLIEKTVMGITKKQTKVCFEESQ